MLLNSKNKGLIIALKDGIATVSGLKDVQVNELVVSEKNFGLVLNLNKFTCSIVFFSENNLRLGSQVTRTYNLVNVTVSSSNLNCVTNSLGQLLNTTKNYNKISFSAKRKVELKAPGILIRQSVYEPVRSGTKVIDSLIPVGKGQRELIIGDRQTGKTSVAIDAIISSGLLQ